MQGMAVQIKCDGHIKRLPSKKSYQAFLRRVFGRNSRLEIYLAVAMVLHMFDTMKKPIQFSGPSSTIGFIQLVLKVFQSFLLCSFNSQRLPQIANIVGGLIRKRKFRDNKSSVKRNARAVLPAIQEFPWATSS